MRAQIIGACLIDCRRFHIVEIKICFLWKICFGRSHLHVWPGAGNDLGLRKAVAVEKIGIEGLARGELADLVAQKRRSRMTGFFFVLHTFLPDLAADTYI